MFSVEYAVVSSILLRNVIHLSKVQGLGYEVHFSIPIDSKFEAGCSSKGPQNSSTNDMTLTVNDYMNSDNTMIEYALISIFGDLF
jgi:hypothetical protein